MNTNKTIEELAQDLREERANFKKDFHEIVNMLEPHDFLKEVLDAIPIEVREAAWRAKIKELRAERDALANRVTELQAKVARFETIKEKIVDRYRKEHEAREDDALCAALALHETKKQCEYDADIEPISSDEE